MTSHLDNDQCHMSVVRLELHIALFKKVLVRRQVVYAHISMTRGLADVMEIALRSSLSELHVCHTFTCNGEMILLVPLPY